MSKNTNLENSKKNKNDEFLTCIEDIKNELLLHKDYKKHFKNKIIFMNCDNPKSSNFWIFFVKHFDEFKLKKIISTHYVRKGHSYKLEWSGEKDSNGKIKNLIKTRLNGNGDFRSDECVKLLKESDIVVTNPPFSLFREYVSQLMKFKKKFLIIGNKNAITYKEIFPLLKNNKMWLGYNSVKLFKVPNSNTMNNTEISTNGTKYAKFGNIGWFTNLKINKRNKPLSLTSEYKGNKKDYPRFDNYNAINIDKIDAIPCDFFGIMGVPITFMDKFCPKQFEIIGHEHDVLGNGGQGVKEGEFRVNKKGKFKRILIKRK